MEELPAERAQQLLTAMKFGYLGFAKGGDAYVLPLFYGYDGKAVYFHSHPGLKEDYLHGTREACFITTRIDTPDDWESVQVFGTVEKVTLTDEMKIAMKVLISVPLPPEYGVSEMGEPKRSAQDMFFWKLAPTRIAGRRSARPPPSDDMSLV